MYCPLFWKLYETNTSRLHSMTDARSNTATYAYNLDNTLASTTYTPTGTPDPSVSFLYDPVYNRVKKMTDSTGDTCYHYNTITGSATTGAGRLHTVVTPIATGTATVTYSYDELGRVTNRTIDGATTNANNVGTTFDALGRVTGVTNPLGSFIYAYVNTTSRLNSVTYPSGTGLSTSYSYFDNTGDQRLQTIQNMHGSTQLSKFDHTYNAVGTLATWTQQADSSTAVVNTLSYDNADQLTSAVQSGGGSASNAYAYDPAGNRLAETTASGTTAGQFNNLNQLTAISGATTSTTVAGYTSGAISSATVNALPATVTGGTNFTANVPLPNGTNIVSIVAQPTSTTGTITTQQTQIILTGTAPPTLSYDANGNTLTDENGNSYTWDALNRLTQITYPSGASTLFAYDGLSRRISIVEKNSSGTVTSTKLYLWIGQEIAEERDASNTVTKRFFPQGEQQSGTPYYYAKDHLGSIREICNSSGTILTRYSYDPYGRTTATYTSANTSTPPVDAKFQYAHYFIHAASGLYLTKYRAYDANTGRWLSRDPISEKGGLNIYEYVWNNAVNAVDPLGLQIVLRSCCLNEAQAVLDAAKRLYYATQSLGATNALVGNPAENTKEITKDQVTDKAVEATVGEAGSTATAGKTVLQSAVAFAFTAHVWDAANKLLEALGKYNDCRKFWKGDPCCLYDDADAKIEQAKSYFEGAKANYGD